MVGPRHGVQPIPNTTPSSGAAATPTLGIRSIRNSRRPNGSSPANISPRTMVSAPITTEISVR